MQTISVVGDQLSSIGVVFVISMSPLQGTGVSVGDSRGPLWLLRRGRGVQVGRGDVCSLRGVAVPSLLRGGTNMREMGAGVPENWGRKTLFISGLSNRPFRVGGARQDHRSGLGRIVCSEELCVTRQRPRRRRGSGPVQTYHLVSPGRSSRVRRGPGRRWRAPQAAMSRPCSPTAIIKIAGGRAAAGRALPRST